MTPCSAFVRVTRRPLFMFLAILALALSAGISSISAEPILLGVYPPGVLSDPAVVDTMGDIDNWLAGTGKRLTIAGSFSLIENAPGGLTPELEGAWSRGYVPYVNIKTRRTLDQIVNGAADADIRGWAIAFAQWASTGHRRAFLTILQEMNGSWNSYYGSPSTFQQAYRHIRQIINEELANHGITHRAVSWVFAPNGWPGNFVPYYPGADVVDVVSINGYNFGGCEQPPLWQTFDMTLKPWLDLLPAMAPGKPIFISETGTVQVPANGVGDKNQWLQELFTRLTTIPNFRGILYLNTSEVRTTLPNCPASMGGADYRLHLPGTNQWPGFWNAMAALPNYVYWGPNSPELAQFFGDVTPRRNHDFNGDGTTDILWMNTSSGNIALWYMSGNGTVLSSIGLGNVAGWTPMVGDFNGDGIADILWQHSSGAVGLWLMKSNGTVQSPVGLGIVAGWTPSVGDFNGDGIADILWQHSAGNAALWLMNANGTVQSSVGLGNLAGWTPRVGDFNGDGIADIVWQDPAGNVVLWLMNANGTLQSGTGLGNLAGWTPSVGDFNGDGIADIVWQDSAGNVVLWLMNANGTVQTGVGLGNAAGWTPK